jgi:hypothetical protein
MRFIRIFAVNCLQIFYISPMNIATYLFYSTYRFAPEYRICLVLPSLCEIEQKIAVDRSSDFSRLRFAFNMFH